jgi:hypothetical protein
MALARALTGASRWLYSMLRALSATDLPATFGGAGSGRLSAGRLPSLGVAFRLLLRIDVD